MTIRLSDHGILIRKKQLGETKHVLTFFTKNYGQIKGVGRISKKNPLDLGAQCAVNWSARLEEQLGFVDVESYQSPTTFLLGKYTKLLALQSMLQLLAASLVDRHPYLKLYEATEAFLSKSDTDMPWQAAYIHFELTYLEELGFGLDLTKCALTGETEELHYLSPQTGRACTQAAGTIYKEKLFVIPELFKDNRGPDFLNALTITGHFLTKNLFAHGNLPQARMALFNEVLQMKKVG